MEKEALLELLKSKNVITKNNKRKFCWKTYFTDDVKNEFLNFSKNYRTEEEAWFCLLNNIEPCKCEVCGKTAKFTGSKKSKNIGYNTVCEKCSANCSNIKLDKFNKTISKRTVEQKKLIFDKRKHTNFEKYGDENYTLYNSEKFKQTMKDRYGDEHYNNHEKTKRTCLEKYGVSCNLSLNAYERSFRIWKEQHDKIIQKIKDTNLKIRGTEYVGQSKEVIDKIIGKKKENVQNIEQTYNCTQQCKLFKKYGQGWKVLGLEKLVISGRKFISNEYIPLIEQYSNEKHLFAGFSNKEKELLSYIKSVYHGRICENVTNVISKNKNSYYELDIFLPDEQIAFEFNGTYWHSDKFKDKYYHQRKTILCYAQNIQLIHIYEHDWDIHKDEIKKHIIDLLNNNNCEKYNWINVNDFKNFNLSKPKKHTINGITYYDEGKFIKKQK